MTVMYIILSCVCFAAALAVLPIRQLIAPGLSFVGMMLLSLHGSDGYPILPINTTIITGWLAMTLVVMLATLLQPVPVRAQTRGMGYIEIGALVGMAVGLLGFTFSSSLALLYGIMIIATVAGIFFGFLLYTNTPDGRPVGIQSGNFFRYILAKGFPTAITVMQLGIVLVLLLAVKNL